MKALKLALVISLLANAVLAWLLWNRNVLDARVAAGAAFAPAITDARPAETLLPALPRWNPGDDLQLRETLFTSDDSFASRAEDPLQHFERTRNRNARPAGPGKMSRDVPALDSDILRPAQIMAPYPSYRENQLQRGLYPGNPRRFP